MNKLIKQFRQISGFDWLLDKSKFIVLPAFDGLPLYDVGSFFIKGLKKGQLTSRASSLAFNFFLAIFPSVIFLFTLIPYIPIKGFQDELLTFIKDVLPHNAYEATRDTIEDIIHIHRGGLLSFGFLFALYFSTNGVNAMMESFNQTSHTIETRPKWRQRLISVLLTIILSLLVLLAVAILIFSELSLVYLRKQHYLERSITIQLFSVGKWLTILALFFTAISFLYYFGPALQRKYRFVSAGSTLATILCILLSVGFAYYVNNFGSYNKLYGSIGTLIVIMLWLYFNSLILLIGFELNASIDNAGATIRKPKPKPRLFSRLRK